MASESEIKLGLDTKAFSKALQDAAKEFRNFSNQLDQQINKEAKNISAKAKDRKLELDHLKKTAKHSEQERQKQDRWQKTAFAKIKQKVGGQVSGRGMAGAAGSIAGGLFQFIANSAQQGYQTYSQYSKQLGSLAGLGNTGRGSTAGLRRGRRDFNKMGFGLMEAIPQSKAMARATGALGPRELMFAQRATGMEMGETAEVFQAIRQGGTTFAGGQNKGRSEGATAFAKIIKAGIISGLEKGRLPEFVSGVTKMIRMQGQISAGTVDPEVFARQLALLGASGKAGMQGERGAQVMGRLQQTFLKPGGGEYGMQMMRMAMGFGRQGPEGADFYGAEKRREKGLGDPQNMGRLFDWLEKTHGVGQEGMLVMRELTGLTLEQNEALRDIYASDLTSAEKEQKIKEQLEKAEPLDVQALKVMNKSFTQLKHLASLSDQQIAIGQTFAPAMRALEKAQLEALSWLIQMGRDVRDIYIYLSDWIDRKSVGEKVSEAVAAAKLARTERAKNMTGMTSQQVQDEYQRRGIFATKHRRKAMDSLTAIGDDEEDIKSDLAAIDADRLKYSGNTNMMRMLDRKAAVKKDKLRELKAKREKVNRDYVDIGKQQVVGIQASAAVKNVPGVYEKGVLTREGSGFLQDLEKGSISASPADYAEAGRQFANDYKARKAADKFATGSPEVRESMAAAANQIIKDKVQNIVVNLNAAVHGESRAPIGRGNKSQTVIKPRKQADSTTNASVNTGTMP